MTSIFMIVIICLAIWFVYDMITCDFCTDYLDNNLNHYKKIASDNNLFIESSRSERMYTLGDNNIKYECSSKEALIILNKLKNKKITSQYVYDKYNKEKSHDEKMNKLYNNIVRRFFS